MKQVTVKGQSEQLAKGWALCQQKNLHAKFDSSNSGLLWKDG